MIDDISKVSWCNVCDDCQRHPCICMVGGAEVRAAYPEACHWPDRPFRVVDEPGEHAPCYLVMPDGASLAFVHHATNGVDQARAAFVANACNRALRIESATTPAEVDAPGIDTANHAGVRVRGYTVEQYATLARQLAEAKAENAIATSVHEHERLNLMSQLAAATRRLGEVEGLVGKWREESPNTQSAYDIHNRYGDALENCADELEAALTKEPTK